LKISLNALEIGTSNSTTFELEEDDGPVYFLGWTKGVDVQINYDIKVPPPSLTRVSSSPNAAGIPTNTKTSVSTTRSSERSGSNRATGSVKSKSWILVMMVILTAALTV
jgi:hypothetical protein